MRSEKLAAPGIVLGAYPERRLPEMRWTGAVGALLSGRRRSSPGDHQARIMKLRALERTAAEQPDPTLRDRITRLRALLARDGLKEFHVTEGLALAAAISGRVLGTVPYDTQLIAACHMLDGHFAEMATGEGKTLAVALTAAIAALAGTPVHVVTANDYLVRRDASSLRPLFDALGLTVGEITPEHDSEARRAAYACDIVYCTAKELVFDYLRDRATQPRQHQLEERALTLSRPGSRPRLLRGLCMAVIDEADSVLVDEARVPLILSRSRPAADAEPLKQAWELHGNLHAGRDFFIDTPARRVGLTDPGRARLRSLAATTGFRWPTHRHCEDAVVSALTARHLLASGRDYLVKDGGVHIIDPTTGRTASGRAWSHGLHQLVEIKEGVGPGPQIEPLEQITYQRFFPRYLRLCGISGTLMECRGELARIYGGQVRCVPLRRANRRRVFRARTFATQRDQFEAVVTRVAQLHQRGQPVLIGTDSVADSEMLARALAARALRHAVLNARQDRTEAGVIAAAGRRGAITVATNMAGRGTDIILGPGSTEAGGLHVICCQQNVARRIDRQLIGRGARQGDPGSAETYVALDGPLLAHRLLARLLTLGRPASEIRPGWIGALALRLAQRAKERSEKTERALLLRREVEIRNWLAFSGREH